jgi:hypothetical protein
LISENKQAALALLSEIWELAPDMRLGQLMDTLGWLGQDFHEWGLPYLEDDELMAVMVRFRTDLLARSEGASNQQAQPNRPAKPVSGSLPKAT